MTEAEITPLSRRVAALRGKAYVTRRQWADVLELAQRLGTGPRDEADYLDGTPWPFESGDYAEDHR